MSKRSRTTFGCILMLIGMPIMIWYHQSAFRAAMAEWNALPASAVQMEYVIVDRHTEVVGSGKSRRTDHFFELARKDLRHDAPASVVVKVGSGVYESVHNGARWRARIVSGQAFFDPLVSAEHLERSRNASLMGLVVMAFAVLLLWLNLSGRLANSRWFGE